MRLAIIAVGRLRQGPERALLEHYLGRIAGGVELREVEEKRKLPAEALIAREGELLRRAIPAGAVVVALDRRGRTLSCEQFARKLGEWRDGGIGHVAFLIGGAEGLDAGLVGDADLAWSLGAVTWPHLLMRALLAEQLYRAQQILAGHPYHR